MLSFEASQRAYSEHIEKEKRKTCRQCNTLHQLRKRGHIVMKHRVVLLTIYGGQTGEVTQRKEQGPTHERKQGGQKAVRTLEY